LIPGEVNASTSTGSPGFAQTDQRSEHTLLRPGTEQHLLRRDLKRSSTQPATHRQLSTLQAARRRISLQVRQFSGRAQRRHAALHIFIGWVEYRQVGRQVDQFRVSVWHFQPE
tara:strand:- start:23384 stop:23722 length:339 start_codon:yes stop_codon:yes gene_type:complete